MNTKTSFKEYNSIHLFANKSAINHPKKMQTLLVELKIHWLYLLRKIKTLHTKKCVERCDILDNNAENNKLVKTGFSLS